MAVNKITMNTPEGEQTLIDLTGDSVTPETVATGEIFHGADGELKTGTLVMLTWRGEWSSTIQYAAGDVVLYNGSTYMVAWEEGSIPTGLTPEENSDWLLIAKKGDKGYEGHRGLGFLNITFSPSLIHDTSDSYRLLTTAVKDQARVDEVYIGDTLRCGTDLYAVYDVNETYVYCQKKTSIKGESGTNGTSVTVKSVSESTADGGSNVVTFSDDKTLTVKNGKTGSKGSDGYTPVKGTDYFTTADRAEMVADVQAAMDGVPDYWRTALDTGVEAINTALCTAGMNKSAFMFYSDAHWTSGSKMAPTLLKYLYQHTGMTRTFFGGDVVDTEASDYDTMKYLWDWRNQLKDLPNHHSVVGNHDDGNATNNLFSEQYIYGYMYAAEETSDVVRGGVTWYYIDSGSEKTRYIFLDTAYKGAGSIAGEQETFLKESLKSTPDGWHIVVVAHIWYMPDYDQYDVKPIPVTGLSTGAATVATILDNYNARNNEFSECAAKVEFCIGGHVHIDYIGKTPGGIPIILVETDSHHTRSGLSCLIGTPTESSVNGVIANYNTNKVNIVRIGRGSSFIVDLTTGGSEVVPDEPTYTNILDTVGYQTGYRLNSSGGTTERADRCITGYIPVKMHDVLYFKNIEMLDSDYGCSIAHYVSDKSFKTGSSFLVSALGSDASLVWNSDGTLKSMKHLYGDDIAYIRFSFVKIDDSSIITINEPIPDDPIPDPNPTYTNQIPISTDTDGSIYNEIGYSTGRLSSDGTVASEGAMSVTGFIPCKMYDVVRLQGVNFNKNSNTFGTHRIAFYDSSKQLLSGTIVQGEKVDNLSAVWNDEGDLIQFTVNEYYGGQGDNYAYFRICGDVFDNYPIITVNEPLTDGDEPTYTNLIPLAVDTDGVTIYNGVGYKADTRMSGSSGQFRDNTDTKSFCTGFLPVPTSVDLVIRFKNITFTADAYCGGFYFFTAPGVASTDNVSFVATSGDDNLNKYYSPVYDDNGQLIQITTPNTKSWTHIVVSAAKIDGTSIITVNEPIE